MEDLVCITCYSQIKEISDYFPQRQCNHFLCKNCIIAYITHLVNDTH